MKKLIILICALMVLTPAYADRLSLDALPIGETGTHRDRAEPYPRVALVLSGGGAKGFAHVGVIRVLEEAGIPVDLVVGASMGGLVAALYASGYSPGDMEQMSELTDWRALFSSPASISPYMTAPVLQTHYNILSISFDRHGIGRSLGLLPDHRVVSQMSRLTYKNSHIRDYDQMHIPLRIVATDILSGELVVLNHVPLHAAMRATMAIPGIFSPHYVDGRYLVDGGVVNNLPVSAARDLGADIVISVNVMGNIRSEMDELTSPLSVVTQAGQLMILSPMQSEIEQSDLHIDVSFPDHNAMEFWRYRDFFTKGEQTARNAWEDITALAESVAEYREIEPRDPDRQGEYQQLEQPVIDAVEIDPALDVPGFPLELFTQGLSSSPSQNDIEMITNSLVTARSYESIGYSVRRDQERSLLSLYPISFDRGKHYIGATFLFDGSFVIDRDRRSWQIIPGFSLDLIFSDLISTGSYLTFNMKLSDTLRTEASYTFPLSSSFYARPYVHAGEIGFVSDAQSDQRAAYVEVGQEIGYQLKPYSKFGLGFGISNVWESGGGNSFSFLITPRIDVQNYEPSRFPPSGIRWKGQLDIPIAADEHWYHRFKAEYRHYRHLGNQGTLGWNVSVSSYPGDAADGLNVPWGHSDIGGWDSVPGYAPGRLLYPDSVSAGATYHHRFPVLSGIMDVDLYGILQLQGAAGWEDLHHDGRNCSRYGGIAAAIGFESILGELVIGAGLSAEGSTAVYVLLN